MRHVLGIVAVLFTSSALAAEKPASSKFQWLKDIAEVKALNCSAFKDETYSGDYKKSDLEVKKSVFRKSPLFDGGMTTCLLSQNSNKLEQPIISVSEKAKLLNVPVELYHSDGSGMVGGEYKDPETWFSKCSSDPMTDEIRCSVYNNDFSLVRTKDGYEIFVGGRNYPGTNAMFRSGKETPIKAINEVTFSKENTSKIIEQLSTGISAVTRYTEWPNGNSVDNTLNTRNFLAAKEFLDKIFEEHI